MKQSNLVIGLTGGIGSGKSTATQYLLDAGYPVVDADLIARHVVDIGKPALKEIEETFGTEYLNADGSLNRKKLGALVFNDEISREKLNKIMHQKINDEILMEIKVLKSNHTIIFADIPLLIELDRMSEYDEIWLIYVEKNTQIQRLMGRDEISEEFAEKQLNAQMSLEDKKQYATRIFDNSGDKTELFSQLDQAVNDLKNILFNY